MEENVRIRLEEIAALPLEEAQLDLSAYLDEQEISSFQALKIPKRRAEWLAGRILGKQVFRTQIDPDIRRNQIRIERLSGGQPVLIVSGQRSASSISISHSNGWAAAAIDPLGEAIGVDVELVTRREEAFLMDYFTSTEREWIHSPGSLTAEQKATLLWSSKESVMKVLSRGLEIDPLRIEISEVNGIESGTAIGIFQGNNRFQIQWQIHGEMIFTFAASRKRVIQWGK